MIDLEKLKSINKESSVAIISVPSDENSTFLKGTAEGPEKIIEALHIDSSNMCAENRVDLSKEERLVEIGSFEFNDNSNQVLQIEEPINKILENGVKIIALGGDHAISYPLVKAHSNFFKDLTVLHFDAHPDLYHEFEGNKYSHACPFARVMEQNLVKRMVSVGIRGMNQHQKEQGVKFGVETIEMKNWVEVNSLKLDSQVYISLDLDILDPAFAPGISHYEPGGCSSRDVINLIQKINAQVVGADIVELNPQRDINGMTAMVAAKFLKEIAVKILE